MHTTTSDIGQLNALLNGEMSAVKTYGQTIGKLDESSHRLILRECRTSHAQRVAILLRHIADLGGTPSVRPGAWSGREALTDDGASDLCERTAIAAIRDCETQGCRAYALGLDELTAATKLFILRQFVPEQERTRAAIGRLQTQVLGRDRSHQPLRSAGSIGISVAIACVVASALLLAGVGY